MHSPKKILKRLRELPPDSILPARFYEKIANASHDYLNNAEREGKIECEFKAPAIQGGGRGGGGKPKLNTLFHVQKVIEFFEKKESEHRARINKRNSRAQLWRECKFDLRGKNFLKGKSDNDFLKVSRAAKICHYPSVQIFLRVYKRQIYENDNGEFLVKIADFKAFIASEKSFIRMLKKVGAIAKANKARAANAKNKGKKYNLAFLPGYKNPRAKYLPPPPPTLFELESGDYLKNENGDYADF